MKKIAVVTRSDDVVKEWSDFTHPLFREYAERCNADFLVISGEPPFWDHDNQPHYRLLMIYNLLEKYDRILHLDTDMLINKNCPNIFDEVPEDMIGIIYEDVGNRAHDRRNKIQLIQQMWGDVGWTQNYTNAGTFVLSKQHKDIFLPHNNNFWTGPGTADLHMSYNIHKYGFKVKELSFKWNHMTMFSEEWNDNADRFESYIIHYAGRGVFDEHDISKEALYRHKTDTDRQSCKVEQAKLDYKKIYGVDP